MALQFFGPFLKYFCEDTKLQHNGLRTHAPLNKNKSIMQWRRRSQPAEGGRLKSE
jgi:hypothetical protein